MEWLKNIASKAGSNLDYGMVLSEKWLNFMLPQEGFSFGDLWQIGLLLAAVFACAHWFSRKYDSEAKASPLQWLRQNTSFLALWAGVTLVYVVLKPGLGIAVPVFQFFAFLGSIWIIIGLVSSLIRDRFCADSIAGMLYLATAFLTLSQLDIGIRFLKEINFKVGNLEISAWGVMTGIVAFIFTLWISLALARIIETQIQQVPRISASLKVLIVKIVRILFISVASLVALQSMGINLSALTVLSGAIGLGLGFGLQKVVSNFVSGIILLTDNSIKPGDVIEIDGTYGWINNLRARYASVITRDGTEHLIPNEDLITQRVINWSFTSKLVRIRVPIGVAYGADPHQCIQLIKEAASSIDRVLKNPEPACLLKGFGDSSVDLELRFWLADPSNGVANVKSEVLLKVWDTFKAHKIEIPYPQRDLHIRSSEVSSVTFAQPDPE